MAWGFLFSLIFVGFCFSDAALSAAPEKSLAEYSLEELLEVRVTTIATGTAKAVREAPAIASIITARDIQAMGATNVEEALESVAGLHVSNSSQLMAPKYLIRGITSTYNPQTLVMINDIPITDILRGDRGAVLRTLPVSMISRIEVIRGPGSAVYGADALSGVINLVTKRSADVEGTEVGGRIGSFDTQRAWLLHGQEYGDLKLSLMADYVSTSGHRRELTADAQTGLDAAFGTQASLAPGPVNLSAKMLNLFAEGQAGSWRLRGAFQGNGNVGTGQGAAEALDPNGEFSGSRTLLDLTFRAPSDSEADPWDLSVQASYLHLTQELDKNLTLFPPGANLGNGVFTQGVAGNPEWWERQFRLDAVAIFTGVERHRIRLGAGAFYGHLYRVQESKNFSSSFAPLPGLTDVTDTADVFMPENSRTSVYALAQDEWAFHPDWELTAGLRCDHFSDFGGTANPRAALVWNTTSRLTSKLLYGHAFRAPSFAELYTMNNPVALGNSKLKPETNHVFELGWNYRVEEAWSAALTLFHYDLDNRITFVRDPSGVTATAQNVAGQTGNGLELEGRVRAASALFLTGNYSYQRSTDNLTGLLAGDYPRHKVYARADWTVFPAWTFNTQLTWIGPRDRQPSDPRASLKGYTSLDLILRGRELVKGLSAGASVRNLLDADIREPSSAPGPTSTAVSIPNDLPQAGRNFYVELKYRL